jgi:N-acetylmuramoyl-L-alanine amidase
VVGVALVTVGGADLLRSGACVDEHFTVILSLTMPTDYEVKSGDCISSIAYEHGFFWKTVWNHANNTALRDKRKNPNVLFSGDRVSIPELTQKIESGGTETRHQFRRKGVPSKFRLQLSAFGRPRANLPFTIELDNGKVVKGMTDGEGRLSASIPPGAKTGRLLLDDPAGVEEYAVNFGHLDPVDEIVGVQQRLANLGIACELTGELDEQTTLALKEFQGKNELEPTGQLDDQTRSKLVEMHGS